MKILPEPGWDRLIRALETQRSTALLLGATDSGKTTLARYIVGALVGRRLSTALIDADIGQSSIGLPGTISMKVFHDRKDLMDFRYERMTFLGFTSPARVIPLMASVTGHLVGICRSWPGNILVDTTGLVSGELGKSLKLTKIKAVQPDHIIAVQRKDELEHILSCIDSARIHRLNIPQAARKRSASARRVYRTRKLENYFRDQSRFEHIMEVSVPLFYRGRLFRYNEREMPEGNVIGLNRNEDTAALGIVRAATDTAFFFMSPLRSLRGINRVVCGDMTLSSEKL